MQKDNRIKLFFDDFKLGIQMHLEAIDFIKKHELWDGFWKYGWVSRFLLIIGIIIGWKYLDILFSWWNQSDLSDPIHFTTSVGSLFKDVAVESYNFFFIGSIKYVILIITEVLIFHFARKTLGIIRGIEIDSSFNTFLKAEVRMIKVVIYAFIMETIWTLVAGLCLDIISLNSLKPVLSFFIQCFFLGYVVIDNYNEIFDMKMRESLRYTRKFFRALFVGWHDRL